MDTQNSSRQFTYTKKRIKYVRMHNKLPIFITTECIRMNELLLQTLNPGEINKRLL